MDKCLPIYLEQYQDLIQQLQWLIYDATKLTEEESRNLKRGIQFVQAKIKLAYFRLLYQQSVNRKQLNYIIEQKKWNVDRILTDKYCNKTTVSSYGSKNSVDLYNSYYCDLKNYQLILTDGFLENLVPELIQNADITDLKLLCEEVLNDDILDNLDAVYKIINDSTLAQNVSVCVEKRKNISYLEYCIKLSEESISDLQFILDNYSQLSDFQKFLDSLYSEDMTTLKKRISELQLKKATVELDLTNLDKQKNEWSKSNILVKLLKYRKNQRNDIETNRLLVILSATKNDGARIQQSLEQLLKEARVKLIQYIESKDANLYRHYIDKIKKCNSLTEIVYRSDFFIYDLYNYQQLAHEQSKKKENLNKLRQELAKSKMDYNESISIYKDIIGDNIDLLNRIVEIQGRKGLDGMRLILCIYLLKLINDTNKLSFEDMLSLLNEEDKVKLNDEYQKAIESYLELEKSHIEELYFNYQFPINTGYNDEEQLGFTKIKI